jgi:hypothetical protein
MAGSDRAEDPSIPRELRRALDEESDAEDGGVDRRVEINADFRKV